MAVVGIGIDLIEIERIAETLRRWPKFAQRCFTPDEEAYCASKAFPPQHFAARFAAKEAVGKALGIGMTRWRDVEVVRGRGAPTIALSGLHAARAAELGVTRIHVTLTHAKDTAAAAAVVEA
ncbi:MAG: holo-ACP synthase [Thermoleophilia bacterium]|nr:holo-ACP synthase [Thermoleophilia bacterium]